MSNDLPLSAGDPQQRRALLLRTMNESGVFAHDPLGQLILRLDDDITAQRAEFASVIDQSRHAVAQTNVLLERLDGDSNAILEELRAKARLASAQTAAIEEQAKSQAATNTQFMVASIVRKAEAALGDAMKERWKDELPSTVQTFVDLMTMRWMALNLATFLLCAAAGGGLLWYGMHRDAAVGLYCVKHAVTDEQRVHLWCDLDAALKGKP